MSLTKLYIKRTLGPLGPLLQRGVLVVLQSAQTLIVFELLMLLLFDELLLLLLLSVAPKGDAGCFSLLSSSFCVKCCCTGGSMLSIVWWSAGFIIFLIILIFEDIHLTELELFWSTLWFSSVWSSILFFQILNLSPSSILSCWWLSFSGSVGCWSHDPPQEIFLSS